MATKGRPGTGACERPLVSPANASAGRELGHTGDSAGRNSSPRGPPFLLERRQRNAPCGRGQAGAPSAWIRSRSRCSAALNLSAQAA